MATASYTMRTSMAVSRPILRCQAGRIHGPSNHQVHAGRTHLKARLVVHSQSLRHRVVQFFILFTKWSKEEGRSGGVRIHDVLETIKPTLCTLLYDGLFLPSTSDDASHNEALSSRITALNVLDLGLEWHLRKLNARLAQGASPTRPGGGTQEPLAHQFSYSEYSYILPGNTPRPASAPSPQKSGRLP